MYNRKAGRRRFSRKGVRRLLALCLLAILLWLPLTGAMLFKDVLSAPYNINQYEEGVFDCSQMAGVMEEHLTNNGWNSYIVVLENDRDDSSHAMVVVDAGVRQYLVEPTTKEIRTSYPDDYHIYDWYYDAADAIENSPWGIEEWK